MSKIKVLADLVAYEGSLSGLQVDVFLPYPQIAERQNLSLLSPSIKALIP